MAPETNCMQIYMTKIIEIDKAA